MIADLHGIWQGVWRIEQFGKARVVSEMDHGWWVYPDWDHTDIPHDCLLVFGSQIAQSVDTEVS